jgi:hypothetical protein
MLPSKCKELVRYDDALGREFKAAGQRYDIFNGAKQTLDDALAEATKDASWNTGTIADLRTTAYLINKVCEATSHTIAGLTPEGAVVGTAAEAAGMAKDVLETWVKRIDKAKGVGKTFAEAYVQPGKVVEKQSLFSETMDFATKEEVVRYVQAIAKQAGLAHVAPLARNVAELWKARQAIMEAVAVGRLNDQQRAAEVTAREQVVALKSNIQTYQLQMRVALDTMAPLQTVHDAVQATVRASCSSRPCDEAEKRALERRAGKRDEAKALWTRADELRKNGPDLKANKKAQQSVRDQAATLEKEAGEKLDELAKRIADLIQERNAALDELARGLFCSRCRRTATEIEHAEHVAFQTHLGNVHGAAVAASPEEIAERAAQYDDKIAEAKRQLDAATQGYHRRHQDLRIQFAALEKEQAKLFAAWSAAVKDLEDAARHIQATGEAAYLLDHQKAELCRKA